VRACAPRHGGHVASLDVQGHSVIDQLCLEFVEALIAWRQAAVPVLDREREIRRKI
jgi:hypothetical protein